MTFRRHSVALILPLILLFVACSGGGGGTSTPTSPLAPNTAQIEFDSYGFVNDAREDNGVDPILDLREKIARVARAHSEAMRDHDFFSHADHNGMRVGDRLAAAGIPFSVAAENLATVTNVADPATWVHEQLMASGTHRPNILDPSVELIGVGVAQSGNTYWITQIFVGR